MRGEDSPLKCRFLDEHKEKIEESLFERVKNLFNLKLDVVFYDTTSTYFEGKGPEGLAKKGFSVEDIFKIRPIFHWTPSRVRAHIFICFLAFLFSVSLQRKLFEMNVKESVWKVIRDVRRVKAIKLFIKDKPYLVRTELTGLAHKAFRAVGLRIPPQVQEL